MLKVGVLGAGHLGKIHLRLLNESEKYDLIGFYDPDAINGKKAADEFGYTYFDNINTLIDAVDMVDIVTPTLSHFDCAKKAMEKGRHVFIEKPITNTLAEAETLLTLEKKYGVKGQVGHVERFNPAFIAVKDNIQNPMFIEAHRLAEFNPRGTDVPVVLDLMIHDIDAILSVMDSEVKQINASGVSVISNSPDIANARIEFESGTVANVTASRVSQNTQRKFRVFQPDQYLSIDFGSGEVNLLTKMGPWSEGEIPLDAESWNLEKGDALFASIATGGYLGTTVAVFFVLGLIAAAYSSADSALTALTTSFSVDILEVNKLDVEKQIQVRKRVHIGVSLVLAMVIIVFKELNDDSVISELFKMAGFTYGPILGLFVYGVFTKKQ